MHFEVQLLGGGGRVYSKNYVCKKLKWIINLERMEGAVATVVLAFFWEQL
jgi:hypothetical protein